MRKKKLSPPKEADFRGRFYKTGSTHQQTKEKECRWDRDPFDESSTVTDWQAEGGESALGECDKQEVCILTVFSLGEEALGTLNCNEKDTKRGKKSRSDDIQVNDKVAARERGATAAAAAEKLHYGTLARSHSHSHTAHSAAAAAAAPSFPRIPKKFSQVEDKFVVPITWTCVGLHMSDATPRAEALIYR